MVDANLVEIFWSVQGEGSQVGQSSVFVRFGECDLRCAWCDSPNTWLRARRCRIENEPGSGDFGELPNPVAIADTVSAVERLTEKAGGLVSITGGEPLLQPHAVVALARALRAGVGARYRILLETHGLAIDALDEVVDEIDIVSMDWKLASDVRRETDPRHGPVADFHEAHAAFLARATRSSAACSVKVVVTPATRDTELDTVVERVAAIAPETLLVLQPVTPSGTVREAPSARQLLLWLRRCQRSLPNVRVIPQTHKALGVL